MPTIVGTSASETLTGTADMTNLRPGGNDTVNADGGFDVARGTLLNEVGRFDIFLDSY